MYMEMTCIYFAVLDKVWWETAGNTENNPLKIFQERRKYEHDIL
jgi:hypothetical protein